MLATKRIAYNSDGLKIIVCEGGQGLLQTKVSLSNLNLRTWATMLNTGSIHSSVKYFSYIAS